MLPGAGAAGEGGGGGGRAGRGPGDRAGPTLHRYLCTEGSREAAVGRVAWRARPLGPPGSGGCLPRVRDDARPLRGRGPAGAHTLGSKGYGDPNKL